MVRFFCVTIKAQLIDEIVEIRREVLLKKIADY
jgi:hypothetical protein